MSECSPRTPAKRIVGRTPKHYGCGVPQHSPGGHHCDRSVTHILRVPPSAPPPPRAIRGRTADRCGCTRLVGPPSNGYTAEGVQAISMPSAPIEAEPKGRQ